MRQSERQPNVVYKMRNSQVLWRTRLNLTKQLLCLNLTKVLFHVNNVLERLVTGRLCVLHTDTNVDNLRVWMRCCTTKWCLYLTTWDENVLHVLEMASNYKEKQSSHCCGSFSLSYSHAEGMFFLGGDHSLIISHNYGQSPISALSILGYPFGEL